MTEQSRHTDLSDLFNLLRDGKITNLSREEDRVRMRVDTQFIPAFEKSKTIALYITFFEVEDFYFIPWGKDDKRVEQLLSVERLYPAILSSDLNKFNYTEVQLESSYQINGVDGGMLFVKAPRFEIYDEQFDRQDLEKLMEKTRQYWKSRVSASKK